MTALPSPIDLIASPVPSAGMKKPVSAGTGSTFGDTFEATGQGAARPVKGDDSPEAAEATKEATHDPEGPDTEVLNIGEGDDQAGIDLAVAEAAPRLFDRETGVPRSEEGRRPPVTSMKALQTPDGPISSGQADAKTSAQGPLVKLDREGIEMPQPDDKKPVAKPALESTASVESGKSTIPAEGSANATDRQKPSLVNTPLTLQKMTMQGVDRKAEREAVWHSDKGGEPPKTQPSYVSVPHNPYASPTALARPKSGNMSESAFSANSGPIIGQQDSTAVPGNDETAATSQVPRSETSSFTTSSTSPAQPVQTARHIAGQMAYSIAQTGQGTTEIKLSPEELGRVRMTVQAVEGTVTITVTAERPETGDLMRRHAETLSQELLSLGYDDINLSFGGERASGGASGEQNAESISDDAHTLVSATEHSPLPPHSMAEGLDLRL